MFDLATGHLQERDHIDFLLVDPEAVHIFQMVLFDVEEVLNLKGNEWSICLRQSSKVDSLGW